MIANLWHILGFSGVRYLCPIKPRPGETPRFWRGSPAHVGVFKHARDIITPDPRVNSLPVYAPADGTIIELIQHNTLWGDAGYFVPYLNLVTVRTVVEGEFYQLCHIAARSCPLPLGSRVRMGQKIAMTGLNGWVTVIDGMPCSHLHIMVAKKTLRRKEGFVSTRIRWEQTPVYL